MQRRRSAFVPRDPVCSFACRCSLAGASCGGAGQLLIINSAEPGEQGRVQVVYHSLHRVSPSHSDRRARSPPQGLAGGMASATMSIFPAIGGAIWSDYIP